jgi:peptide/nickel transport system substrate-binding protein
MTKGFLRRTTAITALLGLAAPALAADVVAVKDGGELVFTVSSAPPNWNPVTAKGDLTGNRQLQWPIYPHPFLTTTDAEVIVNEALLVSADVVGIEPMVIEFVIKDEAVWSDGTPISAADFIYTQQVQDPRACADCQPAFTQGYELVSDTWASDDGKTVRFTLSQPFGPWRTLFPYILPAHIAATYGDLATSFNEGLTVNVPGFSGGPYMVADYQDGVVLTLKKNPAWYGEPAKLDTVHFRFIASVSEQITALQNGEVGALYGGASLDTVEHVHQLDGINLEIGPTLTYFHFSLKAAEGDVMGDKVLRQAITRALDSNDMTRRTVGQFVEGTEAMTSSAYIPGQMIGGELAVRNNTGETGVGAGDVEGAIKLLEDAGYKIIDGALHGPDGTAIRQLEILTYSIDPVRVQLAELAQAQLAKLGISTFIDAADRSRYSPESQAGNFDIFVTGTAADLGALSLAQWYQTGAARNYFGYSSERVDALVEEISVTLDDAKVVDLTNELDKVLLEDGIVVPLFPVMNMAVFDDQYANIFVNPSKYGTTMNIEQWGIRAE